jgi:hypothetical protein
MSNADLYFSVDIESDGPIPGRYSMLSFGLAVAGRFDGTTFGRRDPAAETFYRELRPISDECVPGAVAVTGLDRDLLIREGADPHLAMTDTRAWIEATAGDDHAVMVGFPLVFDWMFLTWYLQRFTGGSPFGFSSGLDMKSLYAAKAGVPMSSAGRRDLPSALRSNREHTHNAMDDAIEQAEVFANLFEWRGQL